MQYIQHIDANGAIMELTQLTKPKCDHLQCSVLEKLHPLKKLKLICGLDESKNPKSMGANKKRKVGAPSQSMIYFQLLIDLLCQHMFLC